MSSARIFRVENRLAKLARQPGGRTIGEALAAADLRVQAIRDACVASVDSKAAQLAALAAEARRAPAPSAFDDLFNLSDAIFGIASTFDLDALAEAAGSLCDLVDSFRCGEPVNWPAVEVHVGGIRLLAAGQKTGTGSILAGLRSVRQRFVRLD